MLVSLATKNCRSPHQCTLAAPNNLYVVLQFREIMFCKSSIWLIICAVSSATEISACGGKGCTSAKIRGMRAVDCYDKDLTKVPQCLRTDLEVRQSTEYYILKSINMFSQLLHLYFYLFCPRLNGNKVVVL